MKVNMEKFSGTLPYASELFGEFQLLIGWRSKRIEARVQSEQQTNLEILLALLRNKARAYSSNSKAQLEQLLPESQIQIAHEMDGLLTRQIAATLDPLRAPTTAKWKQLVTLKNINRYLETNKALVSNFASGKAASANVTAYLTHQFKLFAVKLPPPPTTRATQRKNSDQANTPSRAVLKTNSAYRQTFTNAVLEKEKRIAQALLWLARNEPTALNAVFFHRDPHKLTHLGKFLDPLQNFGAAKLEAILSPVGIIHIFRQYFFELDTFLGPAVGHVWLSPGGTVELVEISTRKTVTEKSFETSEESIQRREQETRIQDELADAVKEENQNDLKFGFGASAKYSAAVFEAAANTSFDFAALRTDARETTHKRLREQSEKLSEEIKRSFKSTFKVASTAEEFSSKRYVLQNTTAQLVNYELRRKMRQVGVQVQDINTQLCWQVYVDDPGKELGIAKLVHIAEPANLSGLQPPDAPVQLPSKPVELMVQFPYENAPDSEGDEMDVTFYEGDDREGGIFSNEGGIFSNNDKIVWQRDYQIEPPAPGYTLDAHIDYQINHSSVVAATVTRLDAQGKLQVSLNQVNFDKQPFINLKLTTYWNPPDQAAAEAAYQAKMAEYTGEKLRLEKEAYVKAAQERINAASNVTARRFDDLREEERIVVYRQLVSQLMNVGGQGNQHITSELIKSLFDVDNMLYFCAPEWWRPRLHQSQQTFGTTQPITEENTVSWGGASEKFTADNYYITAESAPARLGSSLGWLLQLDGDNFRNAFLNAPWVKAVIPIRANKETEALQWLEQAHVEGAEGLDAEYHAPENELREIKPDGSPVTIREALEFIIQKIRQEHATASVPQSNPADAGASILPTEIVYEHGFNPLGSSVKLDEQSFHVFSQWIEILPTDQIVALEYDAHAHL